MKRFLNILKKALPWVMAALIFGYLFAQYPPEQIWRAVRQVNILYFLWLALVYFSILYFVDCYTMSRALTRFGYPVSVKELFPARGVTYLIMNINYPASQAAFAYYLKRTHQIPIFEVLSVFFFMMVIDLYIVITLAFIGSFFQNSIIRGVDIGEFIRIFVLAAYAFFVFQLAFWRGWFSKITGIKKKVKFIEWIRSKKLFIVFNDATIKDYAKIAILRSPIHISIVLFLFIAVKAFDADVPLVNVLGSVPIAFLIGTVPITPGGLGTTNVAIIELLSPHITGEVISRGIVSAAELIFAVTILWMVVNYTLKTLVGVVWLQKVSKSLFRSTETADSEMEAICPVVSNLHT